MRTCQWLSCWFLICQWFLESSLFLVEFVLILTPFDLTEIQNISKSPEMTSHFEKHKGLKNSSNWSTLVNFEITTKKTKRFLIFEKATNLQAQLSLLNIATFSFAPDSNNWPLGNFFFLLPKIWLKIPILSAENWTSCIRNIWLEISLKLTMTAQSSHV